VLKTAHGKIWTMKNDSKISRERYKCHNYYFLTVFLLFFIYTNVHLTHFIRWKCQNFFYPRKIRTFF
jgi:hypothetical protein